MLHEHDAEDCRRTALSQEPWNDVHCYAAKDLYSNDSTCSASMYFGASIAKTTNFTTLEGYNSKTKQQRPHPLPFIYAYNASASDYTYHLKIHYLL